MWGYTRLGHCPRLAQTIFRRKCNRSNIRPNLARTNSSLSDQSTKSILSEPTWSVESLLSSDEQASKSAIAPKQLHHLLNLSALPAPKTTEEETKMISILSSQLHFVRAIQEVDTQGVSPLRAIRDETQAAEKELEISVQSLNAAFSREEVVGSHYKKIKRRTDKVDTHGAEDWNVLGNAESKVGKYFLVDSKTA